MNRFASIRGRSTPKTTRAINSPKNKTSIAFPKKKDKARTMKANLEIESLQKNLQELDPPKLLYNTTEMQEIAEKIHKANLLKAQENKVKDDEIESLNEEIRKIMLINFELQGAIEKELEERHTYEKEQRKIADYCNDLSYKFRNFEKTIRNYETTVNNMKKENEELADAYDVKIESIDKDIGKLNNRIANRIELYEHQKDQISEKTAKINNLGDEIQRQKNTFNERNTLNKNKFDDLQEKYADMLKKVYELQMGNTPKRPEEKRKEELALSPEEKKKLQIKEIEKKIETCEQDNEELVEEINDLNNKYQLMSKTTEKMGNTLPNFFKSTAPTTGYFSGNMSDIKAVSTKNFY